jgi:hypothetical protein
MANPDFEVVADDRPLSRPAERRVRWAVPVVILLVAAAAGGLYYLAQQRPLPQVAAPAPAAPAQPAPQANVEPPRVEHPIEQAGALPAAPLPALDESDSTVRELLAGIFGVATFDALFRPQDLVRNVVATIDNLPRKSVAPRLIPIKPVPEAFRVAGPDGAVVIGLDNAARYTPYVRAMEAIDSAKLVAIYVRLYPLFQQAYADLGYPSRYFNDRVFEVIDHLLAAPDVRGPVALTQPKVMYEYADPALQDLSAGQKILVRMGGENEAKVKAKLRELKRALTRGL